MAQQLWDEETVREALRRRVGPLLRSHGGGIELHSIRGKLIRVRFLGACSSCMGASETLRNVVEVGLREELKDNEVEVSIYEGVQDSLISEALKILRRNSSPETEKSSNKPL